MTADPLVDQAAIFARYGLRWRYALVSFAGMLLLALGAAPFIQRVPAEQKMRRLTWTARLSDDPQIVQAANQRMVDLERTLGYRTRNFIQFGPSAVGFALIILGGIPALGVKRRVRWATKGRCMGCGYDRRGSEAGARCPECDTPPPPRKGDPRATRARPDQRYGIPALAALGMLVFFGVVIHSFSSLIMPGLSPAKVEEAYESAPRVVGRRALVISPDGSRQVCFLRDAGGMLRTERYTAGAVNEVLLFPVDDGEERYLPATGVKWYAAPDLPEPRRRYESRMRVHATRLARAGHFRAGEIPTEGPYEVYRRRRRAGLHDHHARSIDVVMIDAVSHRPRYHWEGSFDEVLDADAVPPLRELSITAFTYPDEVDPDWLRLDEATPGRLRADIPIHPDWLDPAWVDPVIRD